MKKILLLLFLIPCLGHTRLIPKTTREHNPAMGANSLLLYEWNNQLESKSGIDLQELYLIFGGDIPPIFNSMIFISISQDELGKWQIDPTTAIVRTTNWEEITLLAGRWYIDIGRHNPYFTYQFPFINQPDILTTVFGPNDLIGIGLGFEWQLPVGWKSDFYAEFTQGNNLVFFENDEENYLGDLRWENTIEFSKANKMELSISYGRAEKQLNVWGVDFKYTWYPHRKVLEWAGEYLAKDKYRPVAGFYTHLKSEFVKDWWLQYRFDYTGMERDRVEPIIRRHTALIGWVPSKKMAIRMQFDSTSDGQEKNEESFLLQLNIGIGAYSENTY